LPLAGEHPKGVTDLAAKGETQIVVFRLRFQSIPDQYGRRHFELIIGGSYSQQCRQALPGDRIDPTGHQAFPAFDHSRSSQRRRQVTHGSKIYRSFTKTTPRLVTHSAAHTDLCLAAGWLPFSPLKMATFYTAANILIP
jgi:hypothetical protein